MKPMLMVLLVIFTLFQLSAGTKVKIASKDGRTLTINKGIKDGIDAGMKGKVQKIFVEAGEKIPFTLGMFVVSDVGENTARLHVDKLGPKASLTEAVQVEFKQVLKKQISMQEQLRNLKNKGRKYIQTKRFKRALSVFKKAAAIKSNDRETNLLLEGLHLIIAPKLSFRDYIQYYTRNPASPLLEDLKKKLHDTHPGLPPDNYLEQAVKLIKNKKGYYELTFKNDHVMIYLPRHNFFVDKYEVSNALYLKFANAEGIKVRGLNFSTLNNYPFLTKNFPAIVEYKEADTYCRANNMRLLTESEWEIVAGREHGTYSWGNESPDYAAICRANYESLADGYIDLAPVDKYSEFASPCGAVNMIGNVSEWVDGKVIKGGNFISEKEELTIMGRTEDPDYTGFRCVMEVKK